MINEGKELEAEGNVKILAGNRCYFGVNYTRKSKSLSLKNKVREYKTLLSQIPWNRGMWKIYKKEHWIYENEKY